jgi:hypothetical protein
MEILQTDGVKIDINASEEDPIAADVELNVQECCDVEKGSVPGSTLGTPFWPVSPPPRPAFQEF